VATLTFDQPEKIIEVAAPDTEITIQELYNQIKDYEGQMLNLEEPQICKASGKEPLGGGVLVGITLTLLYGWRLRFEARPGPTTVVCDITGGNLVGQNEGPNEANPTFGNPVAPSAYVTVTKTSSASATLSELQAIQFASYNGGVTLDVLSAYSGTDFPVGTPQEPVNNLDDAYSIAQARGFTTIFVIGDLTITSGNDYTAMTFIGESVSKSTISITAAANVYKAEFYEAHIEGTLDGLAQVKECEIHDLDYVSGYLERCVLAPGTVTLGGTQEAHFLDCWSGVPGTATPTIDLGGSGQALAMRNYNGGILLTNKTGSESVSIDLASGQVKIDQATVTGGTIVVRGDGKVIDSVTGDWMPSGTYNGMTLVNETSSGKMLQMIHEAHFNRRVWDKNGNVITIYAEDGTTPLYQFDTNADLSQITPQ